MKQINLWYMDFVFVIINGAAMVIIGIMIFGTFISSVAQMMLKKRQ